MAQKQYTAVHRILLDAKKGIYAEPGAAFKIEEKEGERLCALGAATGEAEKKAAAKKAPAKKAAAAEGGDGTEMV